MDMTSICITSGEDETMAMGCRQWAEETTAWAPLEALAFQVTSKQIQAGIARQVEIEWDTRGRNAERKEKWVRVKYNVTETG